MGDKITKSPHIRFAGFTDAWEQRNISELAGRYDNLRVPITASDRVAGSIPYYGANGIQDYVDGFTHDGEFILVAEDGASDLKNYPVQYVNGKVWVNNHAHVLQAKENLADSKFLMNAIRNTNIEPFLVGGGRAKLNADVMMKIILNVPNIAEQVKIGGYFNKLDNLIILHQRKLDLLKVTKKSMLQKMFPNDGESVPEIRFAGFTDAWEQRKLDEIASKIGDGLHGTPQYSENGNVYFINGNNLVDGKVIITDGTKRVTEKEQSLDDIALDKNTILMSINGTIGNLALYNGEKLMLGKSASYITVDKSDRNFLFYALQTKGVRDYFFNSLTGTTIKNLGLKTIRDTQIFTPNLQEQEKIGGTFSYIDNLITLHQRELDLLKDLKKSMLQQMFI